ncbi:uncharacterized protein K452DRAFT_275670 [Aplosporella prunicola CBS 121167]|uniref:Uncharacterized protein n=1 Tax=Aplosporella prunicola CBS 121167 TaxID=1176127 RepID=A0A6A6B6X5_9PEZI|nr:uncharacterized protein K452DRAFT_275670 [Aplosporella prunicola CBS 121167]KAF2139398.1 hypothetical protein K452DRAFT_275670 [Aplosporella prunicola CBS 121167]
MATLEVQPANPSSLFSPPDSPATLLGSAVMALAAANDSPALPHPPALSLFERIVTSHPTILESLLAQLPTASLLDLYHSSRHLRDFLANYPLAWKTLSFRAPQPAVAVNNPDADAVDGQRAPKQYALDALLIQVVVPFGTRLTNLDLCNTTVSGVRLVSRVLEPRVSTIQHLSVRGCKNVSIKYHLVPFLEPYVQPSSPWARRSDLALKSLYTYRCRHHRRRPYLPSSLMRRDSDSEPTHQLIEICHQLDIWTDTTWCTTPGGRCFRRKDYYSGRAAPGTNEVWVPFDRLWRSGNRIGPIDSNNPPSESDGRLWEDSETGHDGEPLGTSTGWPSKGEGKDIPAHLRRSHKAFVDDVKCDQCGDAILERCEQCSIRMHCMGCRKTLCASCAFNRPIPRKRQKTRGFTTLAFGSNGVFGTTGQTSIAPSWEANPKEEQKKERFWWAPGATRSPNLMSEIASDDEDSDSDEPNGTLAAPLPIHANAVNALALNNGIHGFTNLPPRLNMHWCCVEPVFSGGGGIVVLGPSVGGKGADRIRATPLPKGCNFEDPDFTSVFRSPDVVRDLKNASLYDHILGEDVDVLPYLHQESLDLQANTCPRSLCQECYRTFRWKVSCRACKKPLCKEHDFRALKVRKCGFRDLHVERDYVRSQPAAPAPSQVDALHIPAFVPPELRNLEPPAMAQQGSTDSHASSEQATLQVGDENPMMASTSSLINPHLPAHPSPLAHSSHPSLHPRPRALSFSDSRPSRSSSPWPKPGASSATSAIQAAAAAAQRVRTPLPLPCNPRHPVQWEGCGAYFCQQLRPVGDCRTRCFAALRECLECKVLVCESCLNANPPCPCNYCSTNYYCPVCTHKPRIKALCRRDAERAAARAKELAEQERVRREAEALLRADEMALRLGEFVRGWEEKGGDEGDGVGDARWGDAAGAAGPAAADAGAGAPPPADDDEKADNVEHVEFAEPAPELEPRPESPEEEDAAAAAAAAAVQTSAAAAAAAAAAAMEEEEEEEDEVPAAEAASAAAPPATAAPPAVGPLSSEPPTTTTTSSTNAPTATAPATNPSTTTPSTTTAATTTATATSTPTPDAAAAYDDFKATLLARVRARREALRVSSSSFPSSAAAASSAAGAAPGAGGHSSGSDSGAAAPASASASTAASASACAPAPAGKSSCTAAAAEAPAELLPVDADADADARAAECVQEDEIERAVEAELRREMGLVDAHVEEERVRDADQTHGAGSPPSAAASEEGEGDGEGERDGDGDGENENENESQRGVGAA